MKTLSMLIIAILLGLSGGAMAGDSGESHQDGGGAKGPVPPNSVGKCWTNDGQANYRWTDCPRASGSAAKHRRIF
jgi:hypothetical protein